MATDAKCVENLAGLSAVRASGGGQCSVLETSTAAETVVHREGTGIALYLGPDRFDLQFAKKELAQDMQTPRMLSTLRLIRFAWYLVGAADVSPFFAYSDEPGTMLVWANADWSGKRNDVQISVRWCCAAGVLWVRSVECGSAGGVVQLGRV